MDSGSRDKLYASQGGPIILSQINTCNGMRCGETFKGPNSPNKPSIWAEDWTSFYQVWGGQPYIRSAQDIAFHVALFIAKNYHGGTNFGRTGASFMITGYYDQAPLDEYGLIRVPKWGHLKELHAAIKLCSRTLLTGTQKIIHLGQFQQAYVFEEFSGACAAFLGNNDWRKAISVVFHNFTYELPQKSISILPDCKTVAFNTKLVSTQHTRRSMTKNQKFDSVERWEEYKEAIPNFDETLFRAEGLLDQISAAKDASDYLWYTLSFNHNSSNAQAPLDVRSLGHVLHALVNGEYIGSAHGNHDNVVMAPKKPRGTSMDSLLQQRAASKQRTISSSKMDDMMFLGSMDDVLDRNERCCWIYDSSY